MNHTHNHHLDSQHPKHAAVLGSPIAHSLSPRLHLAAYQALGLHHWTYERIECQADELAGLVDQLDQHWVGLSITMPNKFSALAYADTATPRAQLVGSANTLIHHASGWHADNTDIDGITGVLKEPISTHTITTGMILGSGGTARAAVMGFAQLGLSSLVIAARREQPAQQLIDLATTLGIQAHYCPLEPQRLQAWVSSTTALINTLPSDVAALYAPVFTSIPVGLDVIYHPWPTPLAQHIQHHGGIMRNGRDMLLHQALTQVELFTGHPAPYDAMYQALHQSS